MAAIASEMGIGASNLNTESRSPVVAVPVGVAVIETGLSSVKRTKMSRTGKIVVVRVVPFEKKSQPANIVKVPARSLQKRC